MLSGKVTLSEVDKKVSLVALSLDNLNSNVNALSRAFARHCREHWKNLLWALPTLLMAAQLILTLTLRKGN